VHPILKLSANSIVVGLPFFTIQAFAQQKPNIIVIYSDDHGWADLGIQQVNKEIKTPNIDALAKSGIRFTHGYVTAPQSQPSRAGVLTGRYQQKFGLEVNGDKALPDEEITIAERLKTAGYVSCQVGKWHLDNMTESNKAILDSAEITNMLKSSQPKDQGFDEYYCGAMNSIYASHDFQGKKLAEKNRRITDPRFRCEWQTDAAKQFITRHKADPFFLYLAYFTPHVPLASVEPWYSQTSSDLPTRRRQALSMIASMDDGVGQLRETLSKLGLDKNTIIFFISDNGAPLRDKAWNGSVNLPLIGEKGMLTDGGIRVPYIVSWPGTIPENKVDNRWVSSLDVAATAVNLAGLKQDNLLDGVDLMSFLTKNTSAKIHETLYWRWRSQAAIQEGDFKFVMVGPDEEYLFNITKPEGEQTNLINEHRKLASTLKKKLLKWNETLPSPGLPRKKVPVETESFHKILIDD